MDLFMRTYPELLSAKDRAIRTFNNAMNLRILLVLSTNENPRRERIARGGRRGGVLFSLPGNLMQTE
jgi:hypothetical protein